MGWFSGRKDKKIKALLEKGAVVIDVRNENEFSQGHFKGSKNIPLSGLNAQVGKLNKSQAVITCCASGIRSGVAKQIMKSAGIEVINGGSWQTVQRIAG